MVRSKIKIKVKVKKRKQWTDLRHEMNRHIVKNKLQQQEKLFVVIDEFLAKLTGFDIDSLHSIEEVHLTSRERFCHTIGL